MFTYVLSALVPAYFVNNRRCLPITLESRETTSPPIGKVRATFGRLSGRGAKASHWGLGLGITFEGHKLCTPRFFQCSHGFILDTAMIPEHREDIFNLGAA